MRISTVLTGGKVRPNWVLDVSDDELEIIRYALSELFGTLEYRADDDPWLPVADRMLVKIEDARIAFMKRNGR